MASNFINKEYLNKTLVLHINRPDQRNSLTEAVMKELQTVLEEAEERDDIHVVILTGKPDFASGVDITLLEQLVTCKGEKQDFLVGAWTCVHRFKKPIIAAVQGYALGGGLELSMMCDIIVVAEDAQLGQPEVKLGLMPGMGGTQRLTRRIGLMKAMDMCLTGKFITGLEAYQFGLVSRVVREDQVLEEAQNIAAQLSQKSLPSLLAIKASIKEAENVSLQVGLESEAGLFQKLLTHEDAKIGLNAFLKKIKPDFLNK